MSTEFYESSSRGYQPDNQAQWGDVIYGPNGRPVRDAGIDPGIYADTGNFNGDPGIYARSNFNGDNGMVVYPSRERLGVDQATYQRMLYDANDSNRGYDPRDNPNFASNWGPSYEMYERANYNHGPNVRLQLGPLQLNFGQGGRQGWSNYDNYNNYGNRGYGEPTYRDSYGRPRQQDNYGWGNGSQSGRNSQYDRYGRDQYDSYGRDQYDGYNGRWNDNYRQQQMQRMYMAMIQQMLQRQRQGQWGQHDRNNGQWGQHDRNNGQWGRDPYGRDQYDQYDRYGRDQYGRDQYGQNNRDPRDMYRDPRYRYDDRSWQQGRDQYGRPYDLDQYGWGQNGRDQYDRYGRDQYGRNGRDQYGRDQYGRDQYGRDQHDRYGRDQYDRYGQNGRGRQDQYWNSLAGTIQQMLGRSIREFDPRVTERRGCAAFVSAALRQSFNINVRDTNCRGLENTLRQNGFQQVDMRDLRPGDVIIGNRSGDQPGHAAIYAGDGKVAQNTSSTGRISVGNASVFNGRSFQRVVAYRPRA